MGWFDTGKRQPNPSKWFRGTGGELPTGVPESERRAEIAPEEVQEAQSAEGLYVFCQSSMVLGFRYYLLTQQLEIDWVGGGGGYYNNVDPDEFDLFLRAESKGSFVHDHLIGRGKKRGEPGIKPYRSK